MEKPDTRSYEFGPFVLNSDKRVLMQDGAPLQLPPKAFDTLLVLIQANDRIVAKEELLKAVWPETFVEENNLNQSISLLRKVLGDSPLKHRYIATIPGRGYRFVAEVRAVREEDRNREPDSAKVPPLRRRTLPTVVLSSVAVLLLSAVGYFALENWRGRDIGQLGVRSIAVLPFRPLGSEGRDEFLEIGMADALITKLSNLRQIQVLPTSRKACMPKPSPR